MGIKSTITLCTLGLLGLTGAWGHSKAELKAKEIFSLDRDETWRHLYWVHLQGRTNEERSLIANHIHIDQKVEDSLYAVVNQFELKTLQEKLPHLLKEFHLMESQDLAHYNLLEGEEFPKSDLAFTTYAELEEELSGWAQEHSDFVELFSAGKSLEGRELWGVRLGPKNLKANAMIPAILFTGSHHAREHLSTEVPLLIARHLVENYSTDPEIQRLVDNRHIYFVPMVNPDGAMFDIVGAKYKMWRKNRRGQSNYFYGVDLNRNYGYQWATGGSSGSPNSEVYHGPNPFSEPETQAIKKLVEQIPNLRILLSFHTYSELILYPWGHKNSGVIGRDGEVFKTMAKEMSVFNGYTPQQASELYIASGDTCDWAYGERSIFCFTFELSPKNGWGPTGFYPGAKAIAPTFQANLPAALYLIERSQDPYQVLSGKKLF